MAWTDYYEFKTIDGPFYCFQEKQSYIHDGIAGVERKELTEIFTGLRCHIGISSICATTEIDKYRLLKKEIFKARPELETYIKVKPIINYTYITFDNNMLEYVMDPYINGDIIEHIFNADIDNYHRIDNMIFKEHVIDYITQIGSNEEISRKILDGIKDRKKIYTKIKKN